MTKTIVDCITGNSFIQQDDATSFTAEISRNIKLYQKQGNFVEVQYKPLIGQGNKIVYTAVLIAKVKQSVEVK